MKTSFIKRHRAGYISFLLVLATGAVLTALMFAAYRRALGAQMIESKVQLRADYGEKEEAILRAIVAITPNQAIRAMKTGSAITGSPNAPLGWPGIFAAALAAANAQNSISSEVMNRLNIPNLKAANTGDGVLGNLDKIFTAIPTNSTAPIDNGVISAGINRTLAGNYPPPLTSTDATTSIRDFEYPIISDLKQYGAIAQASLDSAILNGNAAGAYGLPVDSKQKFNRLKYPAISYGYAKPGEAFVAKRNWWAFSMNVGDHDGELTGVVRPKRNFVLSIYEIPSQLPISAASSMLLGNYANGAAWQNNTEIEGNISVGEAELTGGQALTSLSLRRGLTNTAAVSVGGLVSATPFAPVTTAGTETREAYQLRKDTAACVSLANKTTMGSFFPVSMASESGRAAFIPISQGRAFFDRYDSLKNDTVEAGGALNHIGNNTLSSTSWNNYSIGAQQCAMRLDIIGVDAYLKPSRFRFQYFTGPNTRKSIEISSLISRAGAVTTLSEDYSSAGVDEGGTITLTSPTDIAYGAPGGYTFIYGALGPITFNNTTFADPRPGVVKKGFWRKTKEGVGVPVLMPFGEHVDISGQRCFVVYPERFPAYLALNGAMDVRTNNSLVVNVDYTVNGLNSAKPNIPCQATDYGLVLKECGNLTAFEKGFSLVTNLRLFVGDHLNNVPMPGGPPAGCVPAVTTANPLGQYFPPCSFFAPEKRYGGRTPAAGDAPIQILQRGQVGSLAEIDKVLSTDDEIRKIRPLDARLVGNNPVAPINITNDLTQIRHPAELPPISMMNWLVLLEEVR